MNEPVRKVRGRKFALHQMPDGYLRLDWDNGVDVTERDAEETLEACAQMTLDGKVPLLVDMSGLRSIERAGRAAFSRSTVVTRVALLVESRLSQTLGTFFLTLAKPALPIRLFKQEADAIAWLRSDAG